MWQQDEKKEYVQEGSVRIARRPQHRVTSSKGSPKSTRELFGCTDGRAHKEHEDGDSCDHIVEPSPCVESEGGDSDEELWKTNRGNVTRNASEAFLAQGVKMESRPTFVLNGIARCTAPSGLKKALSFRAVELALRRQCGRDVEPDVDLPGLQIKDGIVKLPFKEELRVDFLVRLGMDEMVRLASHEPVRTAEHLLDESISCTVSR